jgi:hypothetical protein
LPNPFFDGTRLGLEGNMLTTLAIAIPAGLHIAFSALTGYAVRYSAGVPEEPTTFSVFGFVFVSILAIVAMAMVMFFMLAIPTMAYSMGLVAFMLRWIGKHRQRIPMTSAVIGAVLGLIIGLLSTAVVFLLLDIQPTLSFYRAVLRWPAVLTVDGIVLVWFSLNPLANAAAGTQIGWRLGKQLEEVTLYWYW